MHGVEEMNAMGTELLDRFDRVQVSDCKGVVRKDWRKLEGISLHPVAPNESRVEMENSNRAPLNGNTSRMYF